MTGRLYVEKGGMWEEVSEEELRERLTGPTSAQLEAKLYETSVDRGFIFLHPNVFF